MMSNTERLDKLSFEFFKNFSLFEFALKESGYVTAGHYNAAMVDYRGFDREQARNYVPSNSALRLISLSPASQICDGTNWKWTPRTYTSHLGGVVECVKTIRNNLFHGGKRGPHGWFDPERVHELLSIGIEVIDELAQVDENVFAAYSGR